MKDRKSANRAVGPSASVGLGPVAALTLLTLCNICSYTDRVVLNLLIGPIKESLDVSDTAISLLQGLAFAAFYMLAIIPIGRLIDSVDRTKIISIGGFVYGASTFVCGLAERYWMIFAGRMGVGAGESTLQPAGYSLLADLFPREKLAGALAVFHTGAYLGIGGGYVLGGSVIHFVSGVDGLRLPLIGQVEGWQTAFMVAAIPSLIISLLVFILLRDPRGRGEGATKAKAQWKVQPFLPFVGKNAPLLVPLLIGCSMSALLATAGLSWTPSFFIRTYGMTMPQTGLAIGLIIMILSSFGVLVGGYFANRLSRKGRIDAPLLVASLGVGVAGTAGVIMPLMPTQESALFCLGVREMFTVFMFPLAAASIQMVTPPDLRGRMSALYIFVMSIAGNLLGPTVTALMNDYVFIGPSGVRYSLAVVYGVGGLIGVTGLMIARRPFLSRVVAAQLH